MEHLAAELRTCRRIVGLISEAFRRIAHNPPTDPYELDRFNALWTHTAEVDKALSEIVRDVDEVLAPVQGQYLQSQRDEYTRRHSGGGSRRRC